MEINRWQSLKEAIFAQYSRKQIHLQFRILLQLPSYSTRHVAYIIVVFAISFLSFPYIEGNDENNNKICSRSYETAASVARATDTAPSLASRWANHVSPVKLKRRGVKTKNFPLPPRSSFFLILSPKKGTDRDSKSWWNDRCCCRRRRCCWALGVQRRR